MNCDGEAGGVAAQVRMRGSVRALFLVNFPSERKEKKNQWMLLSQLHEKKAASSSTQHRPRRTPRSEENDFSGEPNAVFFFFLCVCVSVSVCCNGE